MIDRHEQTLNLTVHPLYHIPLLFYMRSIIYRFDDLPIIFGLVTRDGDSNMNTGCQKTIRDGVDAPSRRIIIVYCLLLIVLVYKKLGEFYLWILGIGPGRAGPG